MKKSSPLYSMTQPVGLTLPLKITLPGILVIAFFVGEYARRGSQIFLEEQALYEANCSGNLSGMIPCGHIISWPVDIVISSLFIMLLAFLFLNPNKTGLILTILLPVVILGFLSTDLSLFLYGNITFPFLFGIATLASYFLQKPEKKRK